MKSFPFLILALAVWKRENCQIVYPEEEQEDYCKKKIGNEGSCVQITECPTAKEDLKQGKQPTRCGFLGDVPLVCCSDSEASTEPSISTAALCGRRKGRFREADGVLFRNDSYENNEEPDGLEINTDGSYIIQPRILSVGRFRISSEDWPWMMAIYWKPNGSFICNSFLIDGSHLLTAAHCFNGRSKSPEDYYIGLIYNDGTMNAEVTELHIHDDYRESYYYYKDVALVKISPSVADEMPICLPSGVNDGNNLVTKEIVVLDWVGTEYATQKYYVTVTEACDQLYTNLSKSPFPNGITDEMVCASPRETNSNACQVHSGGPVMIEEDGNWKAIAVASFGIPCTLPAYPAIYTRISPYLDWIRSKL